MHSQRRPPKKIAVMEFSSTACKLLIGDVEHLMNGFCWGRPAFHNKSILTNVWFDMHIRNWSPAKIFNSKLRPAIADLRSEAEAYSVDRLFCVATSGYRADKREDLLRRMVEGDLRSPLTALFGDEESAATITAYLWSRNRSRGACLFIDQGGGSTELSSLDAEGRVLQNHVVPWGTLSSMGRLLSSGGALSAALEENPGTGIPIEVSDDMELVGSGSALTMCLGQRNNQNQHERILAKSLLEEQRNRLKRRLLERFDDIADLKTALLSPGGEAGFYQSELKNLLGLQMYLSLMEHYRRDRIRVNGTGLRYGVFHQKLVELYPELTTRRDAEVNDEVVSRMQK